jgi:hypothetical protein
VAFGKDGLTHALDSHQAERNAGGVEHQERIRVRPDAGEDPGDGIGCGGGRLLAAAGGRIGIRRISRMVAWGRGDLEDKLIALAGAGPP